jgi:hypothetical protein
MERVSLLSKQPCTIRRLLFLLPQLAADLLPASGVPYWKLYPNCPWKLDITPRTAAVKAFKNYFAKLRAPLQYRVVFRGRAFAFPSV